MKTRPAGIGNVNADWMGSLPSKLSAMPLKHLAVPGSHDSFTFWVDVHAPVGPDQKVYVKYLATIFRVLAKKVMVKWSMTQNLTFKEQLDAGIRYFDLRVSSKSDEPGNEIYFIHGLFGHKVRDGSLEISSFLGRHRKEVVFLDFNHYYAMDTEHHVYLINMLQEVFGLKLCNNCAVESVTLDYLWEKKYQIAQKYDLQKEEELRFWIEEVTGMCIGENFQKGLKDGVILCELINKLQPGSVKKINNSQLNWHKLENLGNFIKAILAYGLKPNDIFEANDLFENGNMTQVQTTLLALASTAKTKGMDTKIDIGVKYAEKQARHFDDEKIKAGQCVIGLQMGTNKCASQAGMTAYGTRRHLYDPKTQTDKPYDQTTISLQMGTNKGASQAGMSAPGTRRDIFDQKVALQPLDNSTISLQMGTNKVASQRGMSVYGLGRQVYDPKYCAPPTEPVIHTNGSQGTGTNCSEISDSDYQAEFQDDDYHRGYHDEYSSHYNDQSSDY